MLFDEIEKADTEIFNLLLQILEDGILTDSTGRKCDFKNSIIIMTSNIGARLISKNAKSIGFQEDNGNAKSNEKIKELVLREAKDFFKPEFINRVDELIVFNALTKEDIKEISRRMLSELSSRCKKSGVDLSFSDDVIEKIAEKGMDTVYGARPLRRAVTSYIEDPLSEKFLSGEIKAGKSYIAIVEGNDFKFQEL